MARFNTLKIHRSIIQKCQNAPNGPVLLKHIVDMSHSIGMLCCAEGVETEEQLRCVRQIGCDYAQGYLIGRPMPVEQFEKSFSPPGVTL